MSDSGKMGLAFLFAAVLAVLRVAVEDHFRLVQVRQLLMDHGTPIQMDRN